MQKYLLSIVLCLSLTCAKADFLLVPMDQSQSDHLKAYGVAFWVLEYQVEVEWLLNYRGGSFMFRYTPTFEQEMQIRGVGYEKISDGKSSEILAYVTSESVNMDAVKLEKAPKVAVYSPKNKQPWDDAVTLALTYAEIPYEVVYDTDVLDGKLSDYDWLHLHHEDFTGQYGKFYKFSKNQQWYQDEVKSQENVAKIYGFKKVSQMKLAVAKFIQRYLEGGGFLFAMCSATDTYDIALASEGVDICDYMYDGDPKDPDANRKLNYRPTLAFENFRLEMNPFKYEFSNIDSNVGRRVPEHMD
ncbi:MAG: asparagine synthetase B, partial [Bacteroidota bacterium]